MSHLEAKAKLTSLFSQYPTHDVLDSANKPLRNYPEDSDAALKVKEAGRTYEKGKRCLETAKGYLSRGRKNKAVKSLDEAISHSRRALDYCENFFEAYQNIVSAYFLKREYRCVVEVCKEIGNTEHALPGVHLHSARALLILADESIKHRDSKNALSEIMDAIDEAQKEVSIVGATWENVAVLTQAFAMRIQLLGERIPKSLDSDEAETLREALDCQIVCAEKLNEIRPDPQSSKILANLLDVRLMMQPHSTKP